MDVLVDARWSGLHGIGRSAAEILRRLPPHRELPAGMPPLHPLDPLWTSVQIRRAKPKAYYSPGFNPPLHSAANVVFTIHDLIHVEFPDEMSTGKSLYYRTIVRPGVRRAFRILTPSAFSKKEIERWAGISSDRVVVVGNGVGPPFTPDGHRYDPGHAYLLYVGNRKPHKNLDGLLRAHAAAGVAQDAPLVLTGRPDSRMRGRVHFVGDPSDDELACLYRGATALVIPSLYEGFGLPALEAMACGTPVVAADRTALPEVVGEAALFVDPTDEEALTEAIRRVVSDTDLRETMRTRGLTRAAEFTWDDVATRVRSVLDDACRS